MKERDRQIELPVPGSSRVRVVTVNGDGYLALCARQNEGMIHMFSIEPKGASYTVEYVDLTLPAPEL